MADIRVDAPAHRLDALLSEAAARYGDRVAIRAWYGEITFAELDAAASACAKAVRALLGPPPDEPGEPAAVAVAAPLHPDFAVAFYGTLRAGYLAAPVNPLHSAAELVHLFGTAGVRLAFVTAELNARLDEVRDRLPALREAVLLGPGPVGGANDIRTLDDLVAAYELTSSEDGPPADPDAPACVLFTSGTTGPAKGVLLSRRNLTVNAAQVAAAHRLDPSAVVLNHLPKYHLMHLNSAVYAGATQVLPATPDPVAAVELAATSGATHYYTIPMRLARLAADPRLATVAAPALRLILSGGSALAPPVARRLADHFGVPTVQGYGLAETSPLTHSDGPDAPRVGSVGPPVTDTDCRVVSVDTGSPVGTGERGEIQVRGPQVMLGYLDPAQPTGIDADGWLSTGDVGYQDEDGYLFLVDRLKDTFKCDNYLVSPSEVERVVAAHPWVAECVVVDLPDELSGAVPAAFVVLRPDADPAAAVAELTTFVDGQVPYYQRLRHVELVDALPRSAAGKIQRRDLRTRLAAAR
ncbi:class I adenylate-forming enzyme family protein [Virgisporangium aurantiacum]|uniref:AMP-dependent synthetase n=1 Tax=Virgisporangium aurantiacum TaxID=175570 RepID=A0A8J4E617_9ACTN|nr:class I adenylate-forming enzyme family protein [Virgisporangium aurantiacum]GIJ60417.1 AMP-dependent synthetase [Virgisporangium aurantiacum]